MRGCSARASMNALPNIIARPMSYLANRKTLIEYTRGGVGLHPVDGSLIP